MVTFGKSPGGGRRKSAREEAPTVAGLFTAKDVYRAAIVNISPTGVRLSAPELPAEGEELMFRAEHVENFGRVVWRRGNQCGMAFNIPLAAQEVEQLREAANLPSGIGLSREEKATLDDWELGAGK